LITSTKKGKQFVNKKNKKIAFVSVAVVSLGFGAFYAGMATEVAHALSSIGLGSLLHALVGHRITAVLEDGEEA
jgi:Ca2+/H+ antiporter